MTVKEAYNYLTSSYCTNDCDNCNNCCDYCDVNASLNLAVKALEKQMPKKPIKRHGLYLCPNCETSNVYINDCTVEIKFNFCDCCGQAIDWSNECNG